MSETEEQRVQRLEDLEDIRRLKALYATRLDDAVNQGASFAPVLEQFLPDAVWESPQFGHYAGIFRIQGFLEGYKARVSFSLHYILGDIIDVAPDRASAKGQWISWEPTTLDGEAVLIAARYYDDYRLTDDGWKFASVRVEPEFITPYEKGWATPDDRIPPDWKW